MHTAYPNPTTGVEKQAIIVKKYYTALSSAKVKVPADAFADHAKATMTRAPHGSNTNYRQHKYRSQPLLFLMWRC